MKKVKVTKKSGLVKLIVIVLLVLGLILATKLVQNNQENRSNAAAKVNDGSGAGSERCQKINPNARCVASMKTKDGDHCVVGGVDGRVVTGKCIGQYNKTARCCVPLNCIEGRTKCDGSKILVCKDNKWKNKYGSNIECFNSCNDVLVTGKDYTEARCN